MPVSRNSAVACRLIRVACITALGLTATAFADDSGRQTPFVKSVLGHFTAWDADHDGALSSFEIDRLLKDPSVRGDDAAAVSALKLITRGSKGKLPALTATFFNEYNAKAIGVVKKESAADAIDATTAAEGGGRDTPAKPIDAPDKWDKYFVAGKKRIEQAGGTQWSTSRFDLGKMKQGALGDCFFVASLGAVTQRRPEKVKRLINQLPDGSYEATFPGVAPFKVAKLTDAQIAISGTSGEGAFLAVFEQAFGKYRAALRGKTTDVDGTDVLYTGGDSANTLQQLTGHDTKRISFGKTLEKRAAAADTVLPEVRRLLQYNIKHDLAITGGGVIGVKTEAETKTEDGTLPVVPPRILKNHVYVITDYDATTDRVTIWNPHSNDFTPKGEPGLKNGYVTEKGKFTLPLTEAYQFYGSFTFETDQPAKMPNVTKAESPTT